MKFRQGPRDTEILPRATVESAPRATVARAAEPVHSDAFALRSALEKARSEAAEGGLNSFAAEHRISGSITRRQEYWLETCGELPNLRPNWKSAEGLRRAYGWRFAKPSAEQVQFILDLLDAALPVWDRDRPAHFFDKLETHFPHLARYWADRRR